MPWTTVFLKFFQTLAQQALQPSSLYNKYQTLATSSLRILTV